MKILVAVAAYPTLDGNKALYFVHSRNLYYQSEGIDVTVLNFRARKNYVIDNIKVISFKEYKKLSHKFDILILHAVNIRNHYKFLKEYGKEFQKKIFIFHGHEILHVNKYYPKSYNYRKNNIIKKVIRNYYDDIKLYLWRRYF